MRILLTGGTGLIGQALCRFWAAQGHELWVWSRDPEKVATLCSGARGVAQLQDLNGVLLDAVVNLAGLPIADRPWYQARREALWASRVTLTKHLVDWLGTRAQRPAVLISGSAVGFYGDSGEQQPLEEPSVRGNDFGSQLCAAWEAEAQRASELGIRVAVLRTAPVLAPQGGFLARLLPPFRLGLGGRLGSGQQWMPWIHLADEVGLIDFLLQHPECSGPYNACAPHAVRNSAFTASLARALHRPAFFPVPAFVLRTLLGEMSILLLGGQHLAPRRALAAGYSFRFPDLDAALADVLSRH